MSEFTKNIEGFFGLARERQLMKIKRERGDPPPWTTDYVLANFRFCNVHRRDDKVTQWIIKNLFEPLGDQPSIFMAAYVARWFNKIETLELLKPELLGDFNLERMREILLPYQRANVPIFGNAYIIQSPTGMIKLDGILWAIGNVTKRWYEGYSLCIEHKKMQSAHEWFKQFPHMGPFMAYQVVCDLTYTWILDKAEDRMDWTVAGPGAARGLGWLAHDMETAFDYNGQKDQLTMRALMHDVLIMSRDDTLWPQSWGQWEMATVQHWSCEYDKWRRGHSGERLKRRFEAQ